MNDISWTFFHVTNRCRIVFHFLQSFVYACLKGGTHSFQNFCVTFHLSRHMFYHYAIVFYCNIFHKCIYQISFILSLYIDIYCNNMYSAFIMPYTITLPMEYMHTHEHNLPRAYYLLTQAMNYTYKRTWRVCNYRLFLKYKYVDTFS